MKHMNEEKRLMGYPAPVGFPCPQCAPEYLKGTGSCSYPGRCFSFADADGNSICNDTTQSRITSDTTGPGYAATRGSPSPRIPTLSFLSGRSVCNRLCPIGSIRELAYAFPRKEIHTMKTRIQGLIRLGVLIASVTAAAYAINLLQFSSAHDFFAPAISLGLLGAAAFTIDAIFRYRPICRALCPFGVIDSGLSHFGLQNLNIRMPAQKAANARRCVKSIQHVPGHAGNKSTAHHAAVSQARKPEDT